MSLLALMLLNHIGSLLIIISHPAMSYPNAAYSWDEGGGDGNPGTEETQGKPIP